MSSSILIWLILVPFIGGYLCWQGERFSRTLPRWIALISMGGVLVVSLWLWSSGQFALTPPAGAPQFALEYKARWVDSFGISFHLGMDGLALLLVVLTNLLGLMAVACSWREIDRYVGFFYLNLLWNLGGVVGVFLALDLFLFFFLWEMMLVPMFFLIALWGHSIPGGRDRIYSATKFFLFTQFSGLLMLLSILALVFIHHGNTGHWSFDYFDLLATARALPDHLAWPIMLGFFVAFAVKMPVIGLHSWLPDAHSQAPTAGSVDLAGILLKTAAYGMLRFGLPFFPVVSREFAPVAMALGAASVIYAAVVAFSQYDVKRLIAYTSISHMGFVMIGLYAGTEQALQGVMVQMIAHGLSAGALFILCGEIYERLHTRDLRQMGGLWARFPYLPPIMLFFSAASLGLPGLGNFVGEFLILMGSFKVAPLVTVISASGLIFAAVYSLILVQKAFHGRPHNAEGGHAAAGKLEDLNLRELAMMAVLMLLTLALGLYPQPVIDTATGALKRVEQLYAVAPAALSLANP
jgi:NADH-quinone oxidoreductase subunit M